MRIEKGSRELAGACLYYGLVPSPLGVVGLVWRQEEAGTRLERVLLPRPPAAAQAALRRAYPAAQVGSCPAIDDLGERLQRLLGGEAVSFALDALALEACSAFQRRVLLVEAAIPRGWVSTYGRIARHLGVPGGARAVGGALAANPFPLIIPCHRAIREGGELGGFQGGLGMKRALLELEGVRFSPAGKVLAPRYY